MIPATMARRSLRAGTQHSFTRRTDDRRRMARRREISIWNKLPLLPILELRIRRATEQDSHQIVDVTAAHGHSRLESPTKEHNTGERLRNTYIKPLRPRCVPLLPDQRLTSAGIICAASASRFCVWRDWSFGGNVVEWVWKGICCVRLRVRRRVRERMRVHVCVGVYVHVEPQSYLDHKKIIMLNFYSCPAKRAGDG
ncbi:hypothetical protein EVAR_79703_1 [Eumeta japonica]|uniref:Uncharacterized protein n=1 Tax=Eumeta variegata TaxID=151549 RepID=A0A4C1TA31_EUMVA|nr:hypothetical protein EVAR_79703_1 [Eumeta japonica]